MGHATGDSAKLILLHLVIVVHDTMILGLDVETLMMRSVYTYHLTKAVIVHNSHVEKITRLMTAVCIFKYIN